MEIILFRDHMSDFQQMELTSNVTMLFFSAAELRRDFPIQPHHVAGHQIGKERMFFVAPASRRRFF